MTKNKHMKKILLIADYYHPDSSATTNLFRRTMEALAKLGYSVSVYPTELSGNHFSYPEEYNGVKIFKPKQSLDEILDKGNYDYVFSGAVNFRVNFLAHDALKGRNCKWYPMSYDPYAFDPHITAEQKNEYIQQEIEALTEAEKVFFLTEFKEDYIGSPIEDKIEYFMLPCIREFHPDTTKRAVEFDENYINCVFLGDFYLGVENTDFIFRMFEKIIEQNKKIRFYTVGNLGDYGETVELWKKKLGDGYICHKRVSQEESYNVLLDCDVLVSMGHDSANMCPSKIIDFISAGRPILHIGKIKNCCGKKYLEKYPDKYCIYQGDELTAEKVNEMERFIVNAKGREKMFFEQVKELYSDFTMEALIEKILRVFSEV